jgi:hypothetical protein
MLLTQILFFSKLVIEVPLALPHLSGDKASLLRHLELTSPETLALARDWEDVSHSVMKAQSKLEQYVIPLAFHYLVITLSGFPRIRHLTR